MLKLIALVLVTAATFAPAVESLADGDLNCRQDSKFDSQVFQFVVRKITPRDTDIYLGRFDKSDPAFEPFGVFSAKNHESQVAGSPLPRRVTYFLTVENKPLILWLRLTADGKSGKAKVSTDSTVDITCWVGDPNRA